MININVRLYFITLCYSKLIDTDSYFSNQKLISLLYKKETDGSVFYILTNDIGILV